MNIIDNTIFIDQSDIYLDHKNQHPNMSNYHEIINIVKEISNDIVKLQFDKSVRFIHPLFLIHIYNYYEYLLQNDFTNKRIFLYIGYLSDKAQHGILHLLTQYIDYRIIKIYQAEIYDIVSYKIKDSDPNEYENIHIGYNTTEEHRYVSLSSKRNKPYQQLPTIKITGLTHKNIDKDFDDSNDTYLNRKIFYIAMQLKKPNYEIYTRKDFTGENILEKGVWNNIFDKYLGISLEDESSIYAFKNILYECIDNIRKHTQSRKNPANGYMSFYKNDDAKRNEFIICDDYQEGFLNTYLDVLKKEMIRLFGIHKERSNIYNSDDEAVFNAIIEHYETDIKHLEKYDELILFEKLKKLTWSLTSKPITIYDYQYQLNKFCTTSNKHLKQYEEIEVLKKLFNINSTFGMHQAGRIIMHFGIPTLMKLIDQININRVHEKARIDIFIHRYERSYHIPYESGRLCKPQPLPDNSIQGTYIYLSFPYGAHIDNKKDEMPPLKVKVDGYKDILKIDHLQKIEEQIANFQAIPMNDVLLSESHSENTKKSINIGFDPEQINNISEFFRKIFQYTYRNDIKDVLIYNFPIDKYRYYMVVLTDILFEDENVNYKNTSLNMMLLDQSSPKAVFIGGKNKKETCYVNSILSQNYNIDRRAFFSMVCDDKNHKNVQLPESNLFNTNDASPNLLPFDLLMTNQRQEFIYTNMINNFLESEENYEDFHVDTKEGIHINKFYYLKHIFEDSTWINRIAFNLAYHMIKKYGKDAKSVIFVGLHRYSALIISVVKDLLKNNNSSFIIDDLSNSNALEVYKRFKKQNTIKKSEIIFFTPVIYKGQKLTDYVSEDTDNLYVFLKLDSNMLLDTNKWQPFMTKCIDELIVQDEHGDCQLCFEDDVPLYTLDSDGYNIQEVYVDDIKSVETCIDHNISWKNAIRFGHTKRGTNHYLYYIKTLIFFENNKHLISPQLEEWAKAEKIHPKDQNEQSKYIPVILAPAHDTNSSFISLVNDVVFKNNAQIHLFSLHNKEQNIFSLDLLRNKYQNKKDSYKFYFVDDEIASGNTLEYFFNILCDISLHKTFDAVFTMIDRVHEKEQQNIFIAYYDKLYRFLKLNIKPMKTSFEHCYLCSRKEYFQNLVDNASLVFVKHQLQQPVKKLQLKLSSLIEYDRENQLDDFKYYLKMIAVEYVYQNIDKFDDMEDQIKKFYEYIKKYFEMHYLQNDLKVDAYPVLSKILKFESKVALIKALSFPKILYIPSLRLTVHQYVKEEIKDIVKDLDDTKISQLISPKLSPEDVQCINSIQGLNDFAKEYTVYPKNDIDYFNFLVITSAYLKINYILSHTVLTFYFLISKKIRNDVYMNKVFKKELLQKYPVAVKMLTSYSEEKSQYFNEQYKKFATVYKTKYNKNHSLIFSMLVENTKYKQKYIADFKKKLEIAENSTFSEKIDLLYNAIEYIMIVAYDKGVKIKDRLAMYVDVNSNLENPSLVDLFHNYSELDDDSTIETMYRGAVRDHSDDNKLRIRELTDFDNDKFNIWCNFFVSLEKKGKTYIRLTHVSDNGLIPFAVIVVTHNDALYEHINIARILLMLQEQIHTFIDQHRLISLDERNIKLLKSVIGNIDHTEKSIYDASNRYVIVDNPENTELNRLYALTTTTKYGNMKTFLVDESKPVEKRQVDESKPIEKRENVPLCKILNTNFLKELTRYIEARNIILQKKNVKIDFNMEQLDKTYALHIDNGMVIKSMFFEFAVNIYKKANKKQCNMSIISHGKDLYFINDGTTKPPKPEKIFDLKYSTSRTSGIGLYIIKHKLRQYDLQITYESTPPPIFCGYDTTFILKITPRSSE